MNVLILCTGNSCRSQMAEGYLKKSASARASVYSAGIEIHGVNPMAVKVMMEDGIDISNQTSNHVTEYTYIDFDFLITVCDHAKEHFPYFPTRAKRFHHNFPDPSKTKGTESEVLNSFRNVRDSIQLYCKEFSDQNL